MKIYILKKSITDLKNPILKKEYETNSVRTHPTKIGYVQVYDQEYHKWTDMTEWAFLGYQERKKLLLGKDYVPPIYLEVPEIKIIQTNTDGILVKCKKTEIEQIKIKDLALSSLKLYV